uniref:Uncharacterized protein n=1 Tax=Setaria italica TaxID=4555 RepID=K3Z1Q2_SETIT
MRTHFPFGVFTTCLMYMCLSSPRQAFQASLPLLFIHMDQEKPDSLQPRATARRRRIRASILHQ